jgi:Icc-related predicted phosphoesterase
MKILLVSDIHAMSREIEKLKGYAGPSGGLLRVEDRTTISNPILAVANALQDDNRPFDLLLCLGDLTHQAKQLPLMIAWHDLHTVAKKLSISEVIGIIGNHDVMSRADTPEDIEQRTEFLQCISPDFPSADVAFNLEYFAHGAASRIYGKCLLIALNTCRSHGFGFSTETTAQIFEKGTLTDNMLAKVVELIGTTPATHIVVAMHHHPRKVSTSENEASDEMAKGWVLLEALAKTGKPTLVLHGHKHFVNVKPVNEDPASPIVFSSASLCAYPFELGDTQYSNQFHVVEFDMGVTDRPVGKILSWDWGATKWEVSTREHMPYEVYFGAKPDISKIAAVLAQQSATYLDKAKLYGVVPELMYASNDDISALNLKLKPLSRRIVRSKSEVTGMIYEEEFPNE